MLSRRASENFDFRRIWRRVNLRRAPLPLFLCRFFRRKFMMPPLNSLSARTRTPDIPHIADFTLGRSHGRLLQSL